MIANQEIHSLENGLRHYPSRTVQVFKTTHLTRILRKHIHETDADKNRKEFSCEQWIKGLSLMQIQKFEAVRPFVRQLEQNRSWQAICGYQGNVPTQGQYSRKILDKRIQEVLVRTFQTYQHLIPLTQGKLPNTPSSAQFTLLQQGYYPFRIDCTSLKLSPDRYPYVTWGYVASKKQTFPSARIHTVQEGIHGFIANYGPSGGHEHESPVAEVLLNETEEINSWLSANSIIDQPRPYIIFDRGYWKLDRFQDLDTRGWGWSIPWKKRTLIGVQMEIIKFPQAENSPLEILVWGSKTEKPWRRIIGKLDSSNDSFWNVLTNNLSLPPLTVLQLQKERWEIETLFQWIKQHTTIKRPLGKSWMSFVTHCLLVTLLQIILFYYLLLLGFTRWQDQLTSLLENLRYSDLEPWPNSYLIAERLF
ncbi:hypothetical protein CEE45_11525 [Candidatus Heimdallarchaeota archaeon B3_Heim]|nr:MAG: hypothetical protein CEE45_11525 [Candidatus Heimdallarchaeota archaeon B3_Heim]